MPPTGSGRQRLPTVKLLFDHNLAPGLVKRLGDIHRDSAHVTLLGLDAASDATVWEQARAEGYTIVTKDADYADLGMLRGIPPKVIWVRIGNCTTRQVEELFRRNHEAVAAFERDESVGVLSLF